MTTPATDAPATHTQRGPLPMFDFMNRLPGGLMLIPLVLGSIIGTFALPALEIGSFTTALFKDSALPLIALLIFATGTTVTARTSGPVLAHAGVVLLTKSLIPATLVTLLGLVVGIDGIAGVSILALLVAVDNSNGGLWLAFTGRYGDKRDRGAYMSSAVNDGPFFSMLFLGVVRSGHHPRHRAAGSDHSRSCSACSWATSTPSGATCSAACPAS